MSYVDVLLMTRAATSLAYGVTVDPLALLYSCQAWEHYSPLLHFLALVRLRAQRDTLVLNSSGPPLRLQLICLPAEIAHDIFAYVFAALIEDRKRAMLDQLGPCSHSGFCPGPGEQFAWTDEPVWTEHGREGMHERREELLAKGDKGVCFVDHLGFVEGCLSMPDCPDDGDGCYDRQIYLCKDVLKAWDEGVKKIDRLIRSFGLGLLTRPGPTYRSGLPQPLSGSGMYPGEVPSDLIFRPGVIGIAVSASSTFEISASRHYGTQADAGNAFRLDTPRALTTRERDTFKWIARALRLVPAETPSVRGDDEAGGNEPEVVMTMAERAGSWGPTLMVVTRLVGSVEQMTE